MKKKLANNLSLKVISVLIACVIWILVSGTVDPVHTNVRYSGVKVEVKNDGYILDAGKSYQIADEYQTVTVYVTGKKSVVEGRTDIAVEADLTQIVNMDTNPAYVPVTLKSVSGISEEDVTIIPKTIPVTIEDTATKEFLVTGMSTGTPGSGYVVGECTTDPEKIQIQGPESVVNKIKSVVATVSADGMTMDATKKAKITLIDQNGEPMSEEYLQFFNISDDHYVNVLMKLWRVQDDVKIKANYSGTPAKGYQVDKITTTPETISIAGSEAALKKLEDNGNTLEIPGALINVDGINSDLEANVKLSALISEEDELKIPEEVGQSVAVKVSILPYGSREYDLKTDAIQIQGLASDLRASYNKDKISIRVKGTEANLDALKTGDIKAVIDLTGKTAGEYTIPVTITLPDGYEQVEEVQATVQLNQAEKTSE